MAAAAKKTTTQVKAPTVARTPWTKDELKTLKTQARKEPAASIAKMLNRSEGATRQKAMSLGLSLDVTRNTKTSARRPINSTTTRKPATATAATKTTRSAARKAETN